MLVASQGPANEVRLDHRLPLLEGFGVTGVSGASKLRSAGVSSAPAAIITAVSVSSLSPLEERPQRMEAFLDPVRARRQAEIECDHRGTLLAEHGDGAESIPRHKEPKILGQGPFHRREHSDRHRRVRSLGGIVFSLAPQEDPKGTPFPCSLSTSHRTSCASQLFYSGIDQCLTLDV